MQYNRLAVCFRHIFHMHLLMEPVLGMEYEREKSGSV